jgi:hypothetical protein
MATGHIRTEALANDTGHNPASNAVPAVAAQPPAPAAIEPTHCPYRRVTDLLQRLAPGKMRVGFFLGAGCSLAIRVSDGGTSKPLIPDIAGLTKRVQGLLANDPSLREGADKAWSCVKARSIREPTLEDVLGHIRTLKSVCGVDGIDGFSWDMLNKLDATICRHVREIVKTPLPTTDTPYHVLASWIQAIPREKPVEIFTTNYDLSIEQAFEDQRMPYFDGFIGSDNAFLDLESMSVDDLPARWARLWKIHGSINWWMTEKGKIRRSRDAATDQQLLIYPSHLKYDQSRQMPYYAMLDRLRVFMRSGQCIILICGYSFGDEHINAFIAQGLAGNPDAACMGMLFNDMETSPRAIELAKRHANLTLLAADSAIVGTVTRAWHSNRKDNHPAYAIAVGSDLPAPRTEAPAERCKWLLGDFGALGRFLGYQLASRDIEEGDAGAL